MMIQVVREAKDRLTRQVWIFHVMLDGWGLVADIMMYLHAYIQEARVTRRHGWHHRPQTTWVDFLPHSQKPFGADMPLDRVPLPDDVRDEVLDRLVRRTTVYIGHWNRDARRVWERSDA